MVVGLSWSRLRGVLDLLWRLQAPEMLKFFAWQLAHGIISTQQLLWARHVGLDTFCFNCHFSREDLYHLFFECNNAMAVWASMGITILVTRATLAKSSWLRGWYTVHGVLGLVVLWEIWLARNSLLFKNNKIPSHVIASRTWGLYGLILRTFRQLVVHQEERWVPCILPSLAQVVIHIDRSALGSPGPARYGGLCKDNSGRWQCGFYGDVGITDNLHA
uniref:Ribonuclease H protein At1g65750 family n=1 Tax=Cajanus cajan TaxID=3821 RepID=A0A151TEX0_CAJCA|nr:Putative ribonuclease H protein At1g65750 family [Cajanus cajan]